MEIGVIYELIHSFLAVVARNEVLFAMELFNKLLDLMATRPPAKVPQAENKVIGLDRIVPVFDKTLGHFLLVHKRSVAESYDIAMPEMKVRGKVYMLVRGDCYINLLHNGSNCWELMSLR